ncbi:MAG: TlyA family RNA methyltransferase [Deltaproteobacteria bacterium]|nr:MAG: TlyA family RNA methyltransferase [Deltaproteobacteria bacterium]
MVKKRLDQLLVEKGLAETRSRARSIIMAGLVYVNGVRVDKAGYQVREDARLEIKERGIPYVSRGGLKLEGALEDLSLSVDGFVCLDVGASTGGFTDCLLARGARKVYAVDVGKNLLDGRLRKDPRVVVIEGVNFRYAPSDLIPETVDLVTVDVSFISLTLIIPRALPFLKEGGYLLCLVKPQFELSPDRVGKGGVVRDEGARLEAVRKISSFVEKEGMNLLGVVPSRVRGPKGNQEYFLLARKTTHSS